MVRILGRFQRHLNRNDSAAPSSLFAKSPAIPSALRQLRHTLQNMFKRAAGGVYEPDRQRLAEILSGVRGASPIWCGGCGGLMVPVVLSEGDHTRLVAVSCLNPCGVSLPVRAGLLIGGEPDPQSCTIH